MMRGTRGVHRKTGEVVVIGEKIDNDELAEFVTSTLNGIASGVEAASGGSKNFSVPGKVSFEIAVKAVRSSGGDAGLKLQVFSAEGKISRENEEVSRVSFNVLATPNTGPATIPSIAVV